MEKAKIPERVRVGDADLRRSAVNAYGGDRDCVPHHNRFAGRHLLLAALTRRDGGYACATGICESYLTLRRVTGREPITATQDHTPNASD
jgi:hypothetical protein